MTSLSEFARTLYDTSPKDSLLYHYTSLHAFKEIVSTGQLRLSDIRYFNDASEIAFASESVIAAARKKYPAFQLDGTVDIDAGVHKGDPMLMAFIGWLHRRLVNDMALYVGAFTAEGNILSQWRGYCPPQQGISIGFRFADLRRAAQEQGFGLGECQYDKSPHADIALQVLRALEAVFPMGALESDFPRIASSIESDLLRIAALVKNPFFREEKEWRVVTPYIASYINPPIQYRVGKSMLVPYLTFTLPKNEHGGPAIENVFVGPTTHRNQSMNSVGQFLSLHKAYPKVRYCGIPLREP